MSTLYTTLLNDSTLWIRKRYVVQTSKLHHHILKQLAFLIKKEFKILDA